jgi:hypothetical protein
MMTKVQRPDPSFKALVKAAFPNYKGRTFYFDVVSPDCELCLDSYWDSGYRDYHCFISLDDHRHMQLPQNGTMFDGKLAGGIKSRIPDNFALVTHTYSGTKQSIKVTVNSNNATALLAA